MNSAYILQSRTIERFQEIAATVLFHSCPNNATFNANILFKICTFHVSSQSWDLVDIYNIGATHPWIIIAISHNYVWSGSYVRQFEKAWNGLKVSNEKGWNRWGMSDMNLACYRQLFGPKHTYIFMIWGNFWNEQKSNERLMVRT